MALINCPECNKQISDKATACPSCGCPLGSKNSGFSVDNAKLAAAGPGSASGPQQVSVVKTAKSRGIYIILGLFFGFLGIHNFYAGYFGRGVCQLLIVLILGWFVIGFIVVGVWVLIELFVVSTDGAGDKMV
jgi:TM2 domain-containing membrane protein YozV